jgi:hypothetical protein
VRPSASPATPRATRTGVRTVGDALIRFIVSQYRWIAETGGRSTGEQLQ